MTSGTEPSPVHPHCAPHPPSSKRSEQGIGSRKLPASQASLPSHRQGTRAEGEEPKQREHGREPRAPPVQTDTVRAGTHAIGAFLPPAARMRTKMLDQRCDTAGSFSSPHLSSLLNKWYTSPMTKISYLGFFLSSVTFKQPKWYRSKTER